MKNKLFVLCLVAILTITLLGSSSAAQTPSTNDLVKSVESLPMFQATKFDAHYRAPNTDQIETLLEQEGIPLGRSRGESPGRPGVPADVGRAQPHHPKPQETAEAAGKRAPRASSDPWQLRLRNLRS